LNKKIVRDSKEVLSSGGVAAFKDKNYKLAAVLLNIEGKNTNNLAALNNKIAIFNYLRYKVVVEGKKKLIKILSKFNENEIQACVEKLALLCSEQKEEKYFISVAQYYNIDLRLYCEEVLRILTEAEDLNSNKIIFLTGMAYSYSYNSIALKYFEKMNNEDKELNMIAELTSVAICIKFDKGMAVKKILDVLHKDYVSLYSEYIMQLLYDLDLFSEIIKLYLSEKKKKVKMSPFHLYYYTRASYYEDSYDDSALEYNELINKKIYNKYLRRMINFYYKKACNFESLSTSEKPFLSLPYFSSLIEY